MSVLKVIIIDDELSGREILSALLNQEFKNRVEVVSTCASADEGYEAIRIYRPEVVFLDIQMPEGSGFALIERIGNIDFELIFVTAHTEFALKAFKVNALDYLLKPVMLDELENAIAKAERLASVKRVSYPSEEILNKVRKASETLVIATMDGMVFIHIPRITFCEAENNYTVFFLADPAEKIMVAKTLKEIDEMLIAHQDFVRVHRSFIINMKKIDRYFKTDGKIILKSGHQIPISRNKKSEFEEKVKTIS